MNQNEVIKKIKESYYYAYPVGGMYEHLYTQVINPNTKQTDFNEFIHQKGLSTPQTTFIPAPNNDTTYSRAWLDLRNGPVIIETPDTNDRFYSIQLLDLFSETIDNLGKRNYGTKKQRFAIMQEDWQGQLDDDLIVIRSHSSFVLAFLRVLIGSPEQLPIVLDIQNQFKITYYQEDREEDDVFPVYQAEPYAAFLKMVMTVLEEMTLKGYDIEEKNKLQAVLKLDQTMIQEACQEAMKEIIDGGQDFGEDVHHWRIARVNIGRYKDNYFQRSVVWYKGALANVPEESLYPSSFQDQNGELLDGHHQYTLTFTKADLPPVSQFWSLTMYIFRNGFLAENPIDRYSLGDRSDDLVYEKDGSLRIYIQAKAPAEEAKLANWLPCPLETFYLTLRLYGPSKEAIEGIWKPPYVMKIEGKNNG